MARPLRIEYPGAVYHVMSRGHERKSVFRDDRDRERWLDLLATVARQERWIVHAYCLMSNHYHLLLETPEGRITAGVHALNSRYAQWFNWRHERKGYLFEGRFRGLIVQKDEHAAELARYIVLNPVRAKLVRGAGDWRWSSYRATAGLAPVPEWLDVDWTLASFATSRSVARAAYRKFVAEGKGAPSPLEGVTRQIYLGDQKFLRDLDRVARARESEPEAPPRARRPAGPSLAAIQKAAASEFGVSVADLSKRRRGDAKIAAIHLARTLTTMKVTDVAAAFGVKSARVSNVVRQVVEGGDAALNRRIERIRQALEAP